ncbi:hypothetical protein BJY24_001979 [Nocardia transvalensis]|uniref:Uncharacterized protein n=1 Tax=Nocardia transvalensis TaxID=37333 RepID=A0A7W9UHH1_9NOCA|nr:hypothetical protein [Nocardia transvalensis]MBB5913112.1 hypothetical protein [Nocardia transvalensis]
MSVRDQFPHLIQNYRPDPDIDEVDDEPASSYLRATMLEGLRQFEPAASLPGFASIKLTGQPFDDGLFNAAAAEIFSQLDREVRAAAPTDTAEQLSIGFREVHAGSVVLPLAPFAADTPSEEELAMVGPSPLELALIRVLDLHDLLESDEIPVRWTADNVPHNLAHRLRLLIESLDKADAGVEIDLSQHNGRRRKSRLTSRGRQRANRLFEPQGTVEIEVQAGDLAGITLGSEFAQVQLRPGLGKRKIDIVQVPPETAKNLPWDVYLRIEVRTVKSSDRFGERKRTEHQFIRVLDHADPLHASEADPEP